MTNCWISFFFLWFLLQSWNFACCRSSNPHLHKQHPINLLSFYLFITLIKMVDIISRFFRSSPAIFLRYLPFLSFLSLSSSNRSPRHSHPFESSWIRQWSWEMSEENICSPRHFVYPSFFSRNVAFILAKKAINSLEDSRWINDNKSSRIRMQV